MGNNIDVVVKINGQHHHLDLTDRSSLTLKVANPLTTPKRVGGNKPYPIKLAPNNKNLSLLAHPQHPATGATSLVYDGHLKLGGAVIECGQVQISKANSCKLQAELIPHAGILVQEIAARRIPDFMDKEIVIPCPDERCWRGNMRFEDIGANQNFCMSVNGVEYCVVIPSGVLPTEANMDLYLGQLVALINADSGTTGVGAMVIPVSSSITSDEMKLTPTSAASDFDIMIGPNNVVGISELEYITTIAQRQQCVIDYMNSTMSLPHDAVTHYFKPVFNLSAYEEKNPDWSGWVNYYHNGSFVMNTDAPDQHHRYSISPFVRLRSVLEAIATATGFRLKGDLLDEEDFNRSFFLNNVLLDEDIQIPQLGGQPPQPLNVYALSFNLKNHTPDLSVKEFLVYIQNTFGCGVYIDGMERCIELCTYKGALKSAATADWSHRLKEEPCIELRPANKGYKLSHKDNDPAVINSPGLYLNDLIIGNGKTEIESFPAAYPFTFWDRIQTSPDRSWSVLQYDLAATSPLFDMGTNDFGCSISICRGFQPDSLGDLYPMGSPLAVNYAGVQVGDFSLEWATPQGRYEYFYKDWLSLLDTAKRLDASFLLQITDYLNWNYKDKIWVNDLCYLVESLSLSADAECIRTVTAKLIQITQNYG